MHVRWLVALKTHALLCPGLQVVKECRGCGHISTLAGRRRYLGHINAEGAGSAAARARGERQAVNSVCQGSAADLVKQAMVQLVARLQERGLAQHCKMVLQVGHHLALHGRPLHCVTTATPNESPGTPRRCLISG